MAPPPILPDSTRRVDAHARTHTVVMATVEVTIGRALKMKRNRKKLTGLTPGRVEG